MHILKVLSSPTRRNPQIPTAAHWRTEAPRRHKADFIFRKALGRPCTLLYRPLQGQPASALNFRAALVSLCVLDIARGITVNCFLVFGGEGAAKLAGMAHEQAARRNDRAFGHQGHSRDD